MQDADISNFHVLHENWYHHYGVDKCDVNMLALNSITFFLPVYKLCTVQNSASIEHISTSELDDWRYDQRICSEVPHQA